MADISYVATQEGWLYLAVVLDAFSRKVVGWAMADHLRTELVLDALDAWPSGAAGRPPGLIHHSDRGCQYTSLAFGQRLREAGLLPSMGSVGDCYDKDLRRILHLHRPVSGGTCERGGLCFHLTGAWSPGG